MTMFHAGLPDGSISTDYVTTSQHKYLRVDHATSNGLNDASTTAMTWSYHFKPHPTTALNTWTLQISKGSGYAIYWYTSGTEQRIYTYFYCDGHAFGTHGYWYSTTGMQWNPGGWHHIAISWDLSETALADELKCVVDGVLLSNATATGAAGSGNIKVDTGNGFCIGGHDSGSNTYPHDAEYRHVAVYKGVLSTDRMKELATVHPYPGEEGLQSYWPLTTDFKDYAGRHNNDLEPKYSGYVPTINKGLKPPAERSLFVSESTNFTSGTGVPGINAARHADDSAFEFGSGDFTIELWWCNGQMDSNFNQVLCKFASSDMAFGIRDYTYSYGRYWRVGVSSDGTFAGSNHSFKYQYWSSTVTNNVTSATTLRPESSVWTHFAWVYDVSQSTVKAQHAFYMDGVLLTTASGNVSYEHGGLGAVQSSVNDNSAQFTIGNFDTSTDSATYQFDGRLCEIRLWNTARTAGEISGNYNKDIDPGSTGLVAYYKGDSIIDGGVKKIKDHTSNANHLTRDGDGVRFSAHHPFHND